MLKRQIRNAIRDYSPALDALLTSRGMRKHFRTTFQARQNATKRKVYGEDRPTVMSGPFAGMSYLNEVVWGPIEPKWFGTYECELHEIVADALRSKYDTIIDVGSAEGFYSVGFAYTSPSSIVYSFDIDPWARAQQRRLARLNGVENIRFGTRCDHETLDKLCNGRTLVLCDIEGHEYDLLDAGKAGKLKQCDILVETHPNAQRNLNAQTGASYLADHFAGSHDVVVIAMSPRSRECVATLPALAGLSTDELLDCLDERRDFDQFWVWMKARRGGDGGNRAAAYPT